MRTCQRGAVLGSILGIVVCGGAGGLAAWVIVASLGFDGTFGAIAAAIIGMVVATALWAAGTSLLRRIRGTR